MNPLILLMAFYIADLNSPHPAPFSPGTKWFLERGREIRDQIGTDRVLLLPVSEPDASDKSRQWQEAARREWPGKIMLNGPGGRVRPLLSGKMNYLDWHWCNVFDADSKRAQVDGIEVINNTDCGPVVNPWRPIEEWHDCRRQIFFLNINV